jgi:DNA-binding PadR family transcriptional regulator
MPKAVFLGEFEQLVLLTLLRLGEEAYVLSALKEMSRVAGRSVSRGALYRTLDRLNEKGFVTWDVEEKVEGRGGHPRRRFQVTLSGIAALRASRSTLQKLWEGMEAILG